MISMNVRVSRNLMTPALKNISNALQKLPSDTHQQFVKTTPIDTGNARTKTKLVNNKRIEANYPYAGVLDKGRHMTNRGVRGSKQAPRGMTRPVREWMRNFIRKLLRTRRYGR